MVSVSIAEYLHVNPCISILFDSIFMHIQIHSYSILSKSHIYVKIYVKTVYLLE